MIDHYHNKARYPEPAPAVKSWAGWRRKRGMDDAWELVVPLVPACQMSKGEVYQHLMNLSELVAGNVVTWEYCILPAGEQPGVKSPGSGRLR